MKILPRKLALLITVTAVHLSSQAIGEDLFEAKVTFIPAKRLGEPSFTGVDVSFDGKFVPLQEHSDRGAWVERKVKLYAEFGQPIPGGWFELKIHPEFFGDGRYIEIVPPTIKVTSSSGQTRVSIRLYSSEIFYGRLIPRAKVALENAKGSPPEVKEQAILKYFELMNEAAVVAGKRDSAFAKEFVRGLGVAVEECPPSPELKDQVREWVKWECLENAEDAGYPVRVNLSRFLDKVGSSNKAEWKPWVYQEVLKKCLENGVIPLYGHNTLCDKLIEDGHPELGLEIVLELLDQSIVEKLPYDRIIRGWFERAESALRKIDHPGELIEELKERIYIREDAANGTEKKYLELLKIDLDGIAASASG